MTTERTSLDDIWRRYQEANLDIKLDLLREALMVAIHTVRDSGQNPRILHELLLELERKKDGASKGVLDPIPPDNRPRDFAAHLKKRNASLASLEERGGECEVRTVKVKTVDDFDFNDVDLIKIDVEGHEQSVIGGAINVIKKNFLFFAPMM